MSGDLLTSAVSSPFHVPVTRLRAKSSSPNAPNIDTRVTRAAQLVATPVIPLAPSHSSADDRSAVQQTLSLMGMDDAPTPCHCRLSKCIKMYCDCFANNRYCTPACQCTGCENGADNEDALALARDMIRQRNPNAFSVKVQGRRGVKRHMNGCRCSKSRCQKRYCECFRAGIQCTSACQCQNCCNGRESFGELPALGPEDDSDDLFGTLTMAFNEGTVRLGC